MSILNTKINTIAMNTTQRFAKGVQTFKTVRNKLSWTRYKMAKELGISQTQYDYLEKNAKSAQTHVLLRLKNVAVKNVPGLTSEQFWKMFENLEDRK